ncbi:MAG: deoxyribonuclease IV, partial [Candidatus Tectomicrobia bacterium]|nr:deoxyribonuclease IV [Candidatus Tectomicrobia bacterium]
GLHRALLRGRELGCETIQLFTKSARQWAARDLRPEEVDRFRQVGRETAIAPVIAHEAYLTNLAAPQAELFEKSVEAFYRELLRAEQLGIPLLVVHPGFHLGAGEAAGLARVVEAIDRVHARGGALRVQIVLESTSGQGTAIGYTLEHLAALREGVRDPERVGICLDTAHLFAAGYDFRTEAGYAGMMARFEALLGLAALKVIHLNDSKKGLGSRIDRHEHIGQGAIGLEGLAHFLRDPRLHPLPMILETPKETEAADARNLAVLRRLRATPGV